MFIRYLVSITQVKDTFWVDNWCECGNLLLSTSYKNMKNRLAIRTFL
jgi:hypothetical protein